MGMSTAKKRKIIEHVFKTYDSEEIPLAEFIECLSATLSRCPSGTDPFFVFHYEPGEYDSDSTCEVYIDRMETDAEALEREQKKRQEIENGVKEVAALAAQRELNEYLRLKAKFEGKT